MRCRKASREIPAYLYGELAEGKALSLREHLERCSACSEECESLRSLVSEIKEEEVRYPEGWAWDRYMGSLWARIAKDRVRTGPARVPRWRPALALAGALAAVVLAVYALRGGWPTSQEGKVALTPKPSEERVVEIAQRSSGEEALTGEEYMDEMERAVDESLLAAGLLADMEFPEGDYLEDFFSEEGVPNA